MERLREVCTPTKLAIRGPCSPPNPRNEMGQSTNSGKEQKSHNALGGPRGSATWGSLAFPVTMAICSPTWYRGPSRRRNWLRRNRHQGLPWEKSWNLLAAGTVLSPDITSPPPNSQSLLWKETRNPAWRASWTHEPPPGVCSPLVWVAEPGGGWPQPTSSVFPPKGRGGWGWQTVVFVRTWCRHGGGGPVGETQGPRESKGWRPRLTEVHGGSEEPSPGGRDEPITRISSS